MAIVVRRSRPWTRKRRRTVSLFGTIALFVGTAATLASTTASAATRSGGKITLVLLKHYNSFEKSYDSLLATGFEKTHPNVTVHLILPQTGAVYTKFQTMVAGGDPPNVYLANDQVYPGIVSKGALSPVNYKELGVSNIKQLEGEYIPSAVTAYVFRGKLYGVPEELSNYAAFVNKSYYVKAGLAVPTTWDQVCADGPKMTVMKSGVVERDELALPINFAAAEILIANAITTEFGSPLFNASGTASNLLSPPVIKAFTMLQNLVYKCHAFYPALNGTTTAAERTLYGEGRTAMLLDAGSWYTPELTGQYPTVWHQTTVVPYPTVPGRPSVSPDYGYAYTVPAAAPNQSLDWQYVHYLQFETAYDFETNSLYPGLKSLSNVPATKKIPFWSTVWEPTLAKGTYLPLLINGSQIGVDIGNAWDSILLSHANVVSTLRSANSAITPLLNPKK